MRHFPVVTVDVFASSALQGNQLAVFTDARGLSDAEMQAHYIFQNLDKVLRAAGSGLDQAIKSQLYEVSLTTFHDVDAIWGSYMPVPPPRSSMAIRGLPVPGVPIDGGRSGD